MGRTTKTGQECKLYYNTGTHASPVWVEVKRAIDVSVDLSKGEADGSRRESDWKRTRGSLKDFGVDFGYRYKPGVDAIFDDLWDSFMDSTPIEVFVADGDVEDEGTQGPRAYVEVMGMPIDQNLEETAVINIAAKLTDWEEASALVEPDWYVVT